MLSTSSERSSDSESGRRASGSGEAVSERVCGRRSRWCSQQPTDEGSSRLM
jgi:hypothetical protein